MELTSSARMFATLRANTLIRYPSNYIRYAEYNTDQSIWRGGLCYMVLSLKRCRTSRISIVRKPCNRRASPTGWWFHLHVTRFRVALHIHSGSSDFFRVTRSPWEAVNSRSCEAPFCFQSGPTTAARNVKDWLGSRSQVIDIDRGA